MHSQELNTLLDAAWDRMPQAQRQHAVDRLCEILAPANDIQELYDACDSSWFHFSTGMAIRNLLRSDHGIDPKPQHAPITDGELPDLADLYAAQHPIRNWDDFYIQVIEAAAGKRPIGE